MRSLLFVPGDSEKKLAKAQDCGADVVILDLEDAVAPANKAKARGIVAEYLKALKQRKACIYVRVNALTTGLADDDLDAVVPGRPDGIMLPKSAGGVDAIALGAKLAAREAINGLDDGAIKTIPIATETAASIFNMGSYRGASARMEALTWGAEDLAAEIAAETQRLADGNYTAPYQLARSLCLFAAVSSNVTPIDTVFTNFRDEAGLRKEALAARRDGFLGKMVIHPDQVGPVNEIFTPTKESIARAQAILKAFEGGAGVANLNGEMLDMLHVKYAERVLARARAAGVI
ncbi:MAG TPA: CoA ester lyase [Xanthobacteraceae bacterium]|jgi:citrate lyase subunit beta/citryl-CoA lyase|nr:CoA ester lyase [Xanthobacteraceae bacterium]